MKTHTSTFKDNIKNLGRQIDSKITYTLNNEEIELGASQLNSITPLFKGTLLKSVMKEIDIDSNVEIPLGTEINYKFGLKTRSGKNLFKPFDFTKTINQVTFTYSSDGSIKSNGTASNQALSMFSGEAGPYLITLEAGTYTISGATASARLDVVKSNGTSIISTTTSSTTGTFTLNATTNVFIRVIVSKNVQVNNVVIYPQLEKNSVATEYEHYGMYEYLDYGNYIVNKVEKEEDTYSWKITAYDKMLYSMVDYESIGVSYPTTIRTYINALCTKIGLTFANASDTFCNYDKEIQNELFLSEDGSSLDYTFRDVLDQLAEVTGSMICINNDDELELRYIDTSNPTPSKNLLNVNEGYEKGYLNTSNGNFVSDTYSALFNQKIPVESGKTYCLSCDWIMESLDIYLFDENDNYLRGSRVEAKKSSYNIRSTYNASYIKVGFKDGIDVMSDELISDALIMVEEGNDRTEPYEPYVDTSRETIDEKYLKDINVKFGEKFGPVNSIVLSRSAESDNVYLQDTESIEENGLCEIKIKENQFMNFNDRDQYLPDLLQTLDGLEFYINDYSSTGVAYLELGDIYNVKVGEETYKCLILNDTLNVSQGLSEDIFTDRPDKSETDYKKADKTDRRINQAYIIVDKQNQEIEALTSRIETIGDSYTKEQVDQLIQNASEGVTNKFITNGGNNILRNTGLWFEDRSEIEYMYPSGTLYPDDDLFMSADPHYEYWKGNAKKIKEDEAVNLSGILLQTGYLEQQQQVRNGTYTLSFKYRKLITLSNNVVYINDELISLDEESGEIVKTLEITAQNISIKLYTDTDDSCIIYDIMLNIGSEKAEYSQHPNETTTETVNISKGITIQSSDTNTTFKANTDGIRVYNNQDLDNPVTKYTDVGMDTNRINVSEEAEIVKVLWKDVGNNTWISRL